jgi:hypothetical protein
MVVQWWDHSIQVTTGAGLVIHIGGGIERCKAIKVTDRQRIQADARSKTGVQVQVALHPLAVRPVRFEREDPPPGVQCREGKGVVADVRPHIEDTTIMKIR